MLVIKNGEIYLFRYVAHEYFDTDSSCKTCATENTKHITECVYLREKQFANRDVWKCMRKSFYAAIRTWEKTEAVSGKLHAILSKKDWICRTIDDSSAVLLRIIFCPSTGFWPNYRVCSKFCTLNVFFPICDSQAAIQRSNEFLNKII